MVKGNKITGIFLSDYFNIFKEKSKIKDNKLLILSRHYKYRQQTIKCEKTSG